MDFINIRVVRYEDQSVQALIRVAGPDMEELAEQLVMFLHKKYDTSKFYMKKDGPGLKTSVSAVVKPPGKS
jgi:hypothetical protein